MPLQRSEKGLQMLEARYWARQWAEKNRNAEMRRWRGGVMPRPVLAFKANEPTAIALAFREGLPTKSKFGPDQVMYSLQLPPEHVTFLDADVAQRIRTLDPDQGEVFFVCKRKGAERNSAVRWDVWLSPESEKARAAREAGDSTQRHGDTEDRGADNRMSSPSDLSASASQRPITVTLDDPSDLERQLEASLADVRRKKAEAAAAAEAAKRVAVAVAEPVAAMSWTALIEHTNGLTDCYAAALEHANAIGGDAADPESVRTLLVTAFINLSGGKKGRN